jgi:hypothetical protein
LSGVQLDLNTKKLRDISVRVKKFNKDIEAVVVTAYAKALADAAAYKKQTGCAAWVNAGGCIWTVGSNPEQSYCAGCTAEAFSAGEVSSIDAVAEAGMFHIKEPFLAHVTSTNVCLSVFCDSLCSYDAHLLRLRHSQQNRVDMHAKAVFFKRLECRAF